MAQKKDGNRVPVPTGSVRIDSTTDSDRGDYIGLLRKTTGELFVFNTNTGEKWPVPWPEDGNLSEQLAKAIGERMRQRNLDESGPLQPIIVIPFGQLPVVVQARFHSTRLEWFNERGVKVAGRTAYQYSEEALRQLTEARAAELKVEEETQVARKAIRVLENTLPKAEPQK